MSNLIYNPWYGKFPDQNAMYYHRDYQFPYKINQQSTINNTMYIILCSILCSSIIFSVFTMYYNNLQNNNPAAFFVFSVLFCIILSSILRLNGVNYIIIFFLISCILSLTIFRLQYLKNQEIYQVDITLPNKYSLADGYTIQVYDQGELNSCVPHSIISVLGFYHLKKFNKWGYFSRLNLYYYARIDSSIDPSSNRGLSTSKALISLQNRGVARESSQPYNIHEFNKPPPQGIQLTFTFQYFEIHSIIDLKRTIVQGCPVIFTYPLYRSFWNTLSDGILPSPDIHNEKYNGDHAMTIYGFNDDTRKFIVLNSWGHKFGYQGWYYISYDDFFNPKLARDFWGIRIINDSLPSVS